MNVSSVGASLSTQAYSKPESAEVPGVADHDGDKDGGAAKASVATAAQQAQPTVNTSGQKLGQVINVTA